MTSPLDRIDVEGLKDGTLANALVMTGCRDEEDLIDMANVGNGLMERIDLLTRQPGPFKDWSPADDPCEIVFDLINAMDEAEVRAAELIAQRAALVEAAQELATWFQNSGSSINARWNRVPGEARGKIVYGILRALSTIQATGGGE